jgi:hypothetical protein
MNDGSNEVFVAEWISPFMLKGIWRDQLRIAKKGVTEG